MLNMSNRLLICLSELFKCLSLVLHPFPSSLPFLLSLLLWKPSVSRCGTNAIMLPSSYSLWSHALQHLLCTSAKLSPTCLFFHWRPVQAPQRLMLLCTAPSNPTFSSPFSPYFSFNSPNAKFTRTHHLDMTMHGILAVSQQS